MELNKETPDFISYKKVLLFGAESVGKTSFSYILKSGGQYHDNLSHSEESNYKILIYNYIL